jgi:hypothetical protein
MNYWISINEWDLFYKAIILTFGEKLQKLLFEFGLQNDIVMKEQSLFFSLHRYDPTIAI